jgi:hypothetical protein
MTQTPRDSASCLANQQTPAYMPVCLYLRVFGVRVCADADHEVYSLPIPVSQLEIRLFQFPRGGQAWMLEIRGACRPSLQVLHGLPEVMCGV